MGPLLIFWIFQCHSDPAGRAQRPPVCLAGGERESAPVSPTSVTSTLSSPASETPANSVGPTQGMCCLIMF